MALFSIGRLGDYLKKLHITNKSYYFLSLGLILLMSFYPLMIGAKVLTAYVRNGYVNALEYPKYVIPYTPISIALILSVAILPIVVKLCKKLALTVVSFFGAGVFLISEVLFERITVFSLKDGIADVGSWQTTLCVVTPEVMKTLEYKETIGKALSERYSPVFKVHFYLIALLIVITVTGIVYGFRKMVSDNKFDKKKPLIMQTIAVSVFIGLCILACFTSFYRTGELNISMLSSWLMSVFFIVFGLSAGLYAGGILYFKKPLASQVIPVIISSIATFVMYIGELVLMGGVLYKFGDGYIFNPIGSCPFAPIDILVIILSGVITYVVLYLVRQRN